MSIDGGIVSIVATVAELAMAKTLTGQGIQALGVILIIVYYVNC